MAEDKFELGIKVADRGGLYVTASLTVHVQDENDRQPVFSKVENITVEEVSDRYCRTSAQ